jgi:hypothetical protein
LVPPKIKQVSPKVGTVLAAFKNRNFCSFLLEMALLPLDEEVGSNRFPIHVQGCLMQKQKKMQRRRSQLKGFTTGIYTTFHHLHTHL